MRLLVLLQVSDQVRLLAQGRMPLQVVQQVPIRVGLHLRLHLRGSEGSSYAPSQIRSLLHR
jgi:hypothetical protein